MKKILLLIIFVLAVVGCIFLLKPSDKVDTETRHNLILQETEELGRLELVRYNIQDVIEYKKMRDWLPNSKTILIVAGEVVSCVDLTLIRPKDVVIKGDSVSIVLPMPDVCHVSINHSKSKIYDVQFGLWETPQLVDEAYRQAENQIRLQASDMGIAQQSRDAAVKFMTTLLHTLGFKEVTVSFSLDNYGEQKNRFNSTK